MAADSAERYSMVNMVVSFVVGEAAFVALPDLFKSQTNLPLFWQFAFPVMILTIAGYYLFGRPVIYKWERSNVLKDYSIVNDDARYRWGARLLERGGIISYILGSALGGAPLISWYWCAHRKPEPYWATFGAAFIVAALGSALYLWLAAVLGPWLVLVVAVAILAILIIATLYLNRGATSTATRP